MIPPMTQAQKQLHLEPSSLNEVSEHRFDDDLFDGLEQFYSQDFQTGLKVNDKLSKLIDTTLRAKVSDEKNERKGRSL